MAQHLFFIVLAALVATSLAAPGDRARRHYDGGVGGFSGGGGGGGGSIGGYVPGHGPGHGHGFGAPHYPGGASQSFSKSSASASSSSGSLGR